MVVQEGETYEESRKKRLEENKKRMEELNLNKLAQALRPTFSPKSSPMKKAKPRVPRQLVDPSLVRRSSRVADKPPPSYKEVPIEPLGRPRSYGHKRRDISNRVYASDEDREYAHHRAEELESDLESDYPSFVKPMLQSHVSGGFWLGLPLQFCKSHLSKYDETISLIDEDRNEWFTKYLARKSGLSGGWKGFAVDHELVDGDALVFQLIKPTAFKVYIIRVNHPGDGDGDDEAPNVTQLDVKSKRIRASKK
ncbi:hypothetical protein LguiA_003354 [Lonicera macranthoides]